MGDKRRMMIRAEESKRGREKGIIEQERKKEKRERNRKRERGGRGGRRRRRFWRNIPIFSCLLKVLWKRNLIIISQFYIGYFYSVFEICFNQYKARISLFGSRKLFIVWVIYN